MRPHRQPANNQHLVIDSRFIIKTFAIRNHGTAKVFFYSADYATIFRIMTTNKIIMEIRAGAGGDEASIFAGDLARMYQRYCAKRGWTFSILDANDNSPGL